MPHPESPPPITEYRPDFLPAYVSNGVVGLRVREMPLSAGMMLVSGYTGEHPIRRIEAAATAPYPCAGNLKVNGVWLSDMPHLVEVIDQSYDFSCGELTTRFRFCDRNLRTTSAPVKLEIHKPCNY